MNIEAYILVGGKSMRFGSDKAFAEIGGRTLAERARDTVSEALPESPVYFVAGSSRSFDAEAARLNEPIIYDEIEDCGPVGGLYAALTNARSEWIFLFACDLPLMTTEFIVRLRDNLDDSCDAIVPEQPDRRMQPLCAFYRVADALPALKDLFETKPNAAMMAVIDKLKTCVVRSEVGELWTNVNDSEALAEIARKLTPGDPI